MSEKISILVTVNKGMIDIYTPDPSKVNLLIVDHDVDDFPEIGTDTTFTNSDAIRMKSIAEAAMQRIKDIIIQATNNESLLELEVNEAAELIKEIRGFIDEL